MSDNNKNINNENEEMSEIFTLTDEDGNEIEFEVIAEYEKDGQRYFAMIPMDDEPADDDVCEYVILKLAMDGDEEILVTVDDDDELDRAFSMFKDRCSDEFEILD